MKRFYCTVCGRIKRVRKYPATVADTTSENVMMRVGQCKWHHPQSITARARELAGKGTK